MITIQTYPMTGNELTEVGKLGSVDAVHEIYFSCNDSCGECISKQSILNNNPCVSVNCSMAHMFQSKSAKTLKHAARDQR